MKLENLSKAIGIQEQLKGLEAQYHMVVRGEGLGITIQGSYQDDAFVDAIRSSVTGELSRRIGARKSELAELGITFG
ncbi:hypothetical protein [Serratia fonticola]